MTEPNEDVQPIRQRLWLLKQPEENVDREWESITDAVVVAPTWYAAKTIHPLGYRWAGDGWSCHGETHADRADWPHPAMVTAKEIGFASDDLVEAEVVTYSFA